MARWRAVVFDLDDTLYPEIDYVRGGLRAAAAYAADRLGVEPGAAFEAMWALFERGARGDVFQRWLESLGAGAAGLLDGMTSAYRAHRPSLTPYPDVLPVLNRLRGQVTLGLITEGRRHSQLAKLKALGLAQALGRPVILDVTERHLWKPSPEPFRRWLRGRSIEPGQALYVGDNPAKDFLGARRAGWASARVRRRDGLHRGQEPAGAEAAPDHEIESLDHLIALAGVARP